MAPLVAVHSVSPFFPARRNVIRALWRLDSRDASSGLILPDGQADFVFRMEASNRAEPTSVILAGLDERAHLFEKRRTGDGCFVGIQLQPWAAASLYSIPETVNRRIPVVEILDRKTFSLFQAIASSLVMGHRADLEISMNRLSERIRAPVDHAVRDLLNALSRFPFREEIIRVARYHNISTRTLERHCLRQTGISPGGLIRIFRFVRTTKIFRPGFPLARLALEAGYSDQAHMNREFRRIMNRTPLNFFGTLSPGFNTPSRI